MLFAKPTIFSSNINGLQVENVGQKNVKFDINTSVKIKAKATSSVFAHHGVMLYLNADGEVLAGDSHAIDANTVDANRGGWWGVCDEDALLGNLVTVTIFGRATVKNEGGTDAVVGRVVKSISVYSTGGTSGKIGASDVDTNHVDNHVAVIVKATGVDQPCEIFIY